MGVIIFFFHLSVFEMSLHEKLESRTTNFTRNLCISSSGVGVGEFLASAQSTCTIKTGFFGFLLVVVSIMGVNTWPKALETPLVKQCPGAARTPVKVPVATRVPGCSEYWPQWHWPSEAVYRGPPGLRSVFLQHLTAGAPPTFFPKTGFNRRPQILPQSSPQDTHAQILPLMDLC